MLYKNCIPPVVLILEVLVPPVPDKKHLEADLALVLLGRQPLGRVVALAAMEGHQVAAQHAGVAQDGLLAHGTLGHGDSKVGPGMGDSFLLEVQCHWDREEFRSPSLSHQNRQGKVKTTKRSSIESQQDFQ